MLFDRTAFLKTFDKVTDFGKGKQFDPLKRLCGGRGLVTKEDKAAYDHFLKIMLAGSVEDLDGLGVEEILEAWERRHDFESLFAVGSARDWMESVEQNLPAMRSARHRRVL